MRRSKTLSKPVSNFDPLLQDIRNCLGDNYVFYDECVDAITRAAARHEDASAWFEQMQQVVDGIEEVGISHAGVMFLLQELIRGEAPLVNDMPSLPLHLRIPSIPLPTMELFPHFYELEEYTPMLPWNFNLELPQTGKPLHVKSPPPTGLKNPTHDPLFFSDRTFKSDVEKFFGVKASNNEIPDCGDSTRHVYTSDTDYALQDDLVPRYNPAADDLKVFKELADTTKDNKLKSESDVYVDLQHTSVLLELGHES